MIETLKINVPEGKKAVYNEATQTIKFVDMESVRSKSWEEFCKNHRVTRAECYLDFESNIFPVSNTIRRPEKDRNVLASNEDAEGILALIQLTRLHDEWVGDWKSNSTYYSICIVENTIVIVDCMATQFLLSFPTKELAQEFLNCFKDLIVKAKRFL